MADPSNEQGAATSVGLNKSLRRDSSLDLKLSKERWLVVITHPKNMSQPTLPNIGKNMKKVCQKLLEQCGAGPAQYSSVQSWSVGPTFEAFKCPGNVEIYTSSFHLAWNLMESGCITYLFAVSMDEPSGVYRMLNRLHAASLRQRDSPGFEGIRSC